MLTGATNSRTFHCGNSDVSIHHCYYSISLQLFVINVANIQLRRLIYRDVCRRASVSAGSVIHSKNISAKLAVHLRSA